MSSDGAPVVVGTDGRRCDVTTSSLLRPRQPSLTLITYASNSVADLPDLHKICELKLAVVGHMCVAARGG